MKRCSQEDENVDFQEKKVLKLQSHPDINEVETICRNYIRLHAAGPNESEEAAAVRESLDSIFLHSVFAIDANDNAMLCGLFADQELADTIAECISDTTGYRVIRNSCGVSPDINKVRFVLDNINGPIIPSIGSGRLPCFVDLCTRVVLTFPISFMTSKRTVLLGGTDTEKARIELSKLKKIYNFVYSVKIIPTGGASMDAATIDDLRTVVERIISEKE